MKILITGSTGFIGSTLIQHLQQKGHQPIAAVRHENNGLPEHIPKKIVGSLFPDTDWEPVLNNVDTIIHLAARVHVMQGTAADPLTEFRCVNTMATVNLAQQAAKAKVRRFIYLSSIKVNGEQTLNQSYTAEDQPNPIDPYSISKYEAEQGLLKIAQETGMEVVIIRPPLVYGPNVKGNFQSMTKWINKGIPLPLGSINNQRSLVALENLIDLITVCIDHPAAANQTFLVSDDEDLSTTELLKRLGKALDKPTRLIPVPQKLLEKGLQIIGKGDIAQRLCGNLQVDISKTKQVLGWQPPVSVDEALQRTAQAYLKNLNKVDKLVSLQINR